MRFIFLIGLLFSTATPTPEWWQPVPGTSWHIQFTGEIDLSVEAEVYDLDLFDTSPRTIRQLHAEDRKVICYLNAGAWEDWRPDADQFPAAVLGKDYEGWEGEIWLDIRQIDLLAPIMEARLDLCRARGFDGVDPDNINGYLNDTGFPLTAADQLRYNIWLAEAAHTRGLAIGLKNTSELAVELEPYFDWVITESCFAEDWCDDLAPFLDAGKPVFAIEYTDEIKSLYDFCPLALEQGISVLLKHRELDATFGSCT